MKRDPLTVGLRVDSRTGGHVQVSVFVGRNPGARGRAGVITLARDEWGEIAAEIIDAAFTHVDCPRRHNSPTVRGYHAECSCSPLRFSLVTRHETIEELRASLKGETDG